MHENRPFLEAVHRAVVAIAGKDFDGFDPMALPDGFDREKLLEIGLAMLHLTMHDDGYGARAWKSLDWDLLDAFHEQGWISDPKSKAKSVALTEKGERLAAEFFEKHFGRPSEKGR